MCLIKKLVGGVRIRTDRVETGRHTLPKGCLRDACPRSHRAPRIRADCLGTVAAAEHKEHGLVSQEGADGQCQAAVGVALSNFGGRDRRGEGLGGWSLTPSQ